MESGRVFAIIIKFGPVKENFFRRSKFYRRFLGISYAITLSKWLHLLNKVFYMRFAQKSITDTLFYGISSNVVSQTLSST